MKKTITSLILTAVLLAGSLCSAYGDTPAPALIGTGAIVMDASTGAILYELNSHSQKYPASTTKIMTAILALENLNLDDEIVVDAETPFTEGSRMYLVEGERISVKDVLNGMMTESANDAAVALAKQISGSVEEFAKLMNQKMKEVGGTETNFVTPNGLHDDAHVSSAHDLAMIARYAMRNETFRELVTTYRYVIPATNKQEERYMYNTNRLLYDTKTKVVVNGEKRECKYEGITGIKTGYTGHAGGCLVASAKRGNTELIVVSLGSTDKGRFADCIALLDWGFENYKTVPVMSGGSALGETRVKRGAENRVNVNLKEAAVVTVPVDADETAITTKVALDDSVEAPVKKNQAVGTVQVYQGETLLAQFSAVAAADVEKGGLLSVFGVSDAAARKLKWLGISLLAAVIGLAAVYIALKRRQEKLRRKRRAERQERIRRKEEQKAAAWEQLRRESRMQIDRPGHREHRNRL